MKPSEIIYNHIQKSCSNRLETKDMLKSLRLKWSEGSEKEMSHSLFSRKINGYISISSEEFMTAIHLFNIDLSKYKAKEDAKV